MPLPIDKPKLDNLADEIWKSVERLRGKFKAYINSRLIVLTVSFRRKPESPAKAGLQRDFWMPDSRYRRDMTRMSIVLRDSL